jgi:hypothetical protein
LLFGTYWSSFYSTARLCFYFPSFLYEPSSWHTLRIACSQNIFPLVDPLFSTRPTSPPKLLHYTRKGAREPWCPGQIPQRISFPCLPTGNPSRQTSMVSFFRDMPMYDRADHGPAFDSSRSFSESAFSFVQPTYGSQPSVSSSVAAPSFLPAAQMNHMAYPSNQGKGAYDDQSGPYLNVGSTPVPQVIAYNPARGARGTKVFVDITSLYELQTTNTPIFFLLFGRHKSGASLSKLSQQGGVCSYRVAAEVPQFPVTGWSSAQVPISLYMETGDGDVIAKVDVGGFTYIDIGRSNVDDRQQDASKKRKMSTDSSELMRSPVKRSSSHRIRPKEEFNTYSYTPTDPSAPFSPYLQTGGSYSNIMPQYARPTPGFQGQGSTRQLGYNYSSSATASPPTIKGESPQVSNWSPAYATMAAATIARSPGLPSNAAQTRTGLTSLPSPSVSANPPLIRTSTLQQSPSPASTPHAGHPNQQYNAYALYSQKAKLEIIGDVDSMAQNWSPDEFEARRRLVLFKRSQSGSTITANFQPVSIDDRPQHSICVSCIYWEEKEECFVTSVDTIQLLEQLVAARFTVEEKNRIRRNLEGFRPLTVSKGKADSEEFFKVIMAFPPPKPRNIEKDVKVFHWKDLSSALNKIIGKYVSRHRSPAPAIFNIRQSASPSSTLPPAPALLTPVSSTGYATDSNTGISYLSDHQTTGGGAVSPRSLSGSVTSTAYASSIPARVMSPLNPKPLSNLQNTAPHLHESPAHWPGGQQQHHMPPLQYQTPLNSQPARSSSSWDLSSYLDPQSATAGGGSSNASSQRQVQAMSYAPRTVADSTGGGERMARPPLQHQLQQQSHQIPRA